MIIYSDPKYAATFELMNYLKLILYFLKFLILNYFSAEFLLLNNKFMSLNTLLRYLVINSEIYIMQNTMARGGDDQRGKK